jgi:hypothetical protein
LLSIYVLQLSLNWFLAPFLNCHGNLFEVTTITRKCNSIWRKIICRHAIGQVAMP